MEPRRGLRSLVFAIPVLLLAGCASLPFQLPFLRPSGLERGISQEELSDELNAYAARFTGLVDTAAEEIAATSDDPTLRRRSLLWSLRLNPAMQEAAFLPDPRAGYLRALTVAVMMQRYFTVGDGRRLFGAAQPIAVSTADTLQADALAIGARFLTAAELQAIQKEVEDLAQRFPIQGTQFSLVQARQAVQAVPSSHALTELMTLPLAPFRALQGVDTGAAAIRDFNQTARRFSSIVASLPDDLRGEMLLLLYDAEELRAIREGLASFQLAAESAERVSFAMQQLPDQLRAVLDEEARELLAGAEGPLQAASETMAQAREIAGPLQATATQLREASQAWREVLGPANPAPPGPDAHPFDIRDWESAARAIGTSAVELRGLAAELDAVAGSRALDQLFWRAVALLVVFFGLLLAYRVLSVRLARRT